MYSPQKILIEIASASEKVVSTLNRYAGHKTVESLQLDKLVVGSNAVLETLNKTLLLGEGSIDDRLTDWLGSNEPEECLHTLNQMERILNGRLSMDHAGMNFFRASSFAHTKDISANEATRLFQVRKGYFHFLLMPTDVWNHENEAQRQTPARHNVLCVEGTINGRDYVQSAHGKSGDIVTGVPHEGKVTTAKQGVDTEKIESILGWLDAWNCKEIHKQTALLRQPGTCTWLPSTNAFKRWRNMKDSFLWLHGKAGAGKSVLAASVIEYLKDTLKDDEIMVFFYCDFRNERSTSAAEVMRSLLSQLLQQLNWTIVDHGDLMDELAKGRDEGTSTINDAMLLARYVSRVTEQFVHRPFIIIDALDECKDIEELLDALVGLTKGGLRMFVTSRSLQVIRESFSALPSVSMDMMNYEVSADIKLHVMRVLDSHRRLRIVDTSLKKEIYSTLCRKADGMFRWVQCQLDTIKRCMTAARIREALNNLPGDLDATYEGILMKINKIEEGEVVRRALDWLVAALGPLQLSQIMESLSIDLRRGVLDHESRPVHGPALLDALGSLVTYDEFTDTVVLSHFSVKEYLTGVSTRTKCSMYHIDQQVAHSQLALLCMSYVVAYLKRSHGPGGHEAPPRNTYRSRIYHDDYDDSDAAGHLGISFQSPVSHSLLEYVLRNAFHHLTHINPRSQTIIRAIVDLRLHAEKYPSEWEQLRLKSISYVPWPTLKHDLVLYILTTFAPEPLLRLYLDDARPELKDETNPLIYAAYHSRIEHCRTLLSRGVSLHRSGWEVRHPRQLLPIEVAAEYGDCAIVELFLKAGSPIPQGLFVKALKGNKCTFPGSNVARLLQTDEFVEWAIDSGDEELLLRALKPARYRAPHRHQLSEQDIDIIQRRLIQLDCDPSTQFDETSLRTAVSAGHISTVKLMISLNVPLPYDIILNASRNQNSTSAMIRFLLGAGSDVHVTSPDGNNALHILIRFLLSEDECLESVQVLVDAGCNPSACNLIGETPLHLAVMRGYISLTKYLYSLHGQLPSNILLVMPSLRTASVLRFLTSQGADAYAIAADGDTALHLFLASPHTSLDGCIEGTKALINAGCDPCLRNILGLTAFDIATRNAPPMVIQNLLSLDVLPPSSILLSVCGRAHPHMSPIIECLIKRGFDIHATCPNGDTLLHLSMNAASEIECLRRLEVLVNAGCNPRACNLAGETAFHAAVRRGHILVMEYMLSIGMSAPSDVMLALLGQHRSRQSRCYPTVRFLLDKGCDATIVSKCGETLLHFAVALDVEEDALEMVKLLVQSGCNPSALNSTQETPLHVAARYGHLSVIDYLCSLDMVFPPDVLFVALLKGYSEKTQVIRHLVNKGANASVPTADGDTLLHILLANREERDPLESTKILIDAGCDPRARNLAGETPLHIAARRGFTAVLKHLFSLGISPPNDILRTSTPATIRLLIGKDMDSSYTVSTDFDTELLHRALDLDFGYSGSDEKDCLECAQILVGLGWNPSLINSLGEMPMHIAAKQGQISVVKYLLSQNALFPADILLSAVTLPAKASWCTDQAVQTTRFLINRGASVSVSALNGDTPLHLALRCDSLARGTAVHHPNIRKRAWELVELLLQHGSDPIARNLDGQTPLDFAETQGRFFKENFLRLVRNARAHHLHTSP